MSVLDRLEPKPVFSYFEQIAGIPHGSGNTGAISDYIVSFAEDHDLEYIRDDLGNVIIKKPAYPGHENSAPVILQGHIDMVCEKVAGCDIDMEKEPIRLLCDGETVTADGTTLGGDDGIAVVYMLAILEADDIEHPPIEAVFTVDEEIGMLGAAAMDMSVLEGRRLLNIDSEEEGILLCGCAGGATVTASLPVSRASGGDCDRTSGAVVVSDQAAGGADAGTACQMLRLVVDGLIGGHSGNEIYKRGANAIMLLGRVLNKLDETQDIGLISVNGGGKDNVIPVSAEAIITGIADNIRKTAKECESVFRNEYKAVDPDFSVRVEPADAGDSDQNISIEEITGYTFMDDASKKRIIKTLSELPNGIQRMNPEMPEQVQTSLNIGILKTTEDGVEIGALVRSDVDAEKHEVVGKLDSIVSENGGSFKVESEYPGWQYHGKSEFLELMKAVFTDVYGYEPKVETIHAGVECGYFTAGIEGVDIVSIGPDLKDIHTPSESMDIKSVQRTWKYVLEVLKKC